MDVETLVAAVKVAFWVTAVCCVVSMFAWPMPREKAPAPAAPVVVEFRSYHVDRRWVR